MKARRSKKELTRLLREWARHQPPGTRVDPASVLADRYGVWRHTAVVAARQLEWEGWFKRPDAEAEGLEVSDPDSAHHPPPAKLLAAVADLLDRARTGKPGARLDAASTFAERNGVDERVVRDTLLPELERAGWIRSLGADTESGYAIAQPEAGQQERARTGVRMLAAALPPGVDLADRLEVAKPLGVGGTTVNHAVRYVAQTDGTLERISGGPLTGWRTTSPPTEQDREAPAVPAREQTPSEPPAAPDEPELPDYDRTPPAYTADDAADVLRAGVRQFAPHSDLSPDGLAAGLGLDVAEVNQLLERLADEGQVERINGQWRTASPAETTDEPPAPGSGASESTKWTAALDEVTARSSQPNELPSWDDIPGEDGPAAETRIDEHTLEISGPSEPRNEVSEQLSEVASRRGDADELPSWDGVPDRVEELTPEPGGEVVQISEPAKPIGKTPPQIGNTPPQIGEQPAQIGETPPPAPAAERIGETPERSDPVERIGETPERSDPVERISEQPDRLSDPSDLDDRF